MRLLGKASKELVLPPPLKDELLLLQWLRSRPWLPEAVDPRGKAVHSVWAEFTAGVKNEDERRDLYFASVDVKDAFDSVDLSKMAGILRNLDVNSKMPVSLVKFRGRGGRSCVKECISAGGEDVLEPCSRSIFPRAILKSGLP
jgi:hypothetical protein